MENKIHTISNDTLSFIQKVEEYSKKIASFVSFKHLVRESLQVYTKIYYFKTARLFLLNNVTFEFDHFGVYPEHTDEIEIFELVNDDLINLVLTTSTMQYTYSEKFNNYIMVIPLISIDGLLGLILLESSHSPESIDILTLRMLPLFGSLFANNINIFSVKEREKKSKDLLNQLVAQKTIDIKENSLKLGEKLNYLTSNLSMVIPHEIRTPINQILGSTNYLKKFISMLEIEDKNDVNEIIEDIDKSTQRLRRLTENYIFYSNLVVLSTDIKEIEKIQKQTTESSSSTIYEAAMTKAYAYNREKDLIINLTDASVSISESFLIKIIEEVLDNSLKFSDSGTQIHISSYLEKDYYVVSIKDFGIGMTDEEIKAIGPYVQFDRRINEQQGSGMGLAIVNKLVNLHQGIFIIKSSKNQYTEVIIKLHISRQ